MLTICLTCVNTDCPHAGNDTAAIISCSGYKTTNMVTNYEFIRSMSMNRMAEMLTVGKYNFACKECWDLNGWTHGDQCDQYCTEHCLKWLDQPFKQGEN